MTKLLSIALVAIWANASGQLSTNCLPAASGLVSWWRAEGDALDGWADNHGQIAPTSGGLSPPAVFFAQGEVGQAFWFNGPGILVPDSLSLRLTNALTIEAWVNLPTLTNTRPLTIVGRFDMPVPIQTNSSYWFGVTNGALFLKVSATGSGRLFTEVLTPQPLPTNEWAFVAATYDGAALRVYTNGTLAALTSYSAGIFPGTRDLCIGAIGGAQYFSWPTYGLWAGALDEVSLYNRALDDNELYAIYSAGTAGKCPSPPIITNGPHSDSIPIGEDALLSVAALGAKPIHYQWQFNGQPISGGTNASLFLPNFQTNQAGDYSVWLTNIAGAVLSSNATLTSLPPPLPVPAPAGLISWWPAEGSGWDAAGTNNLTVSSSSGFTPGKVGLAFNPSANGNVPPDGIWLTNAPLLNFPSNMDFSVEAWIKCTSDYLPGPGPTNMPIVESCPTPTNSGFHLSLNHGRLAFGLRSTSSAAPLLVIANTPDLADSRNHHVAVTLQRSSTTGGHLYLDGQPVLTFDPTSQNGDLTSRGWEIGVPVNNYSYNVAWLPYTGFIDEVAVYSRALSANEIWTIWRAGHAGKSPPAPVLSSPAFASSGVLLGLSAFPGRTYQLQRADTLPGPWLQVSSIFVNSNGFNVFTDTNPPDSAFYRAVYP